MLKLTIASDLHSEIYGLKSTLSVLTGTEGTDALILAGDVGRYDHRYRRETFQLLMELSSRYPKIYYTPGNHDFWGIKPEDLEIYVKTLKIDNLMLLLPGSKYTLGDYTVSGGTLWFPEPTSQYDIRLAHFWCDHRNIHNFAPWAYDQNKEFKNKVMNNLGPKDIVVSHHLPSDQSIAEQFKDSDTNIFFVDSSVESLILDQQPALYVHGHTHYSFNYMLGNTRVYCNPRGYPNENSNNNFSNQLLVELP